MSGHETIKFAIIQAAIKQLKNTHKKIEKSCTKQYLHNKTAETEQNFSCDRGGTEELLRPG